MLGLADDEVHVALRAHLQTQIVPLQAPDAPVIPIEFIAGKATARTPAMIDAAIVISRRLVPPRRRRCVRVSMFS